MVAVPKSITTDAAEEITIKISGLNVNTTYYYQIYAVADNIYYLGDIKSFSTLEVNQDNIRGTENGYEYVDLGLSVKWATCNVGASSPEEYGGYYAWGETEEKNVYDWSTYKYCDGTKETCYNIGDDIAGTDYDVAHVKWGGSWRMPTREQIIELDENCTVKRTSLNGVRGLLVTGPTEATIFLPYAGVRVDYSFKGKGDLGYCWSSTLGPNDWEAYDMNFSTSLAKLLSTRNRGYTVRPVCP